MFLKILDVVVLFVAVYLALKWGDLHGAHAWIVGGMIALSNLVSAMRAHAHDVEQIKNL